MWYALKCLPERATARVLVRPEFGHLKVARAHGVRWLLGPTAVGLVFTMTDKGSWWRKIQPVSRTSAS